MRKVTPGLSGTITAVNPVI